MKHLIDKAFSKLALPLYGPITGAKNIQILNTWLDSAY